MAESTAAPSQGKTIKRCDDSPTIPMLTRFRWPGGNGWSRVNYNGTKKSKTTKSDNESVGSKNIHLH